MIISFRRGADAWLLGDFLPSTIAAPLPPRFTRNGWFQERLGTLRAARG
jgi:hypothetical protein